MLGHACVPFTLEDANYSPEAGDNSMFPPHFYFQLERQLALPLGLVMPCVVDPATQDARLLNRPRPSMDQNICTIGQWWSWKVYGCDIRFII